MTPGGTPSRNETPVLVNGQRVATLAPFLHPHISAADTLQPIGAGVFEWTRRFVRHGGAADESVRLRMDLVAPYHASYWLIPAVSYQGNAWGHGLEPKGFARDGTPWSFAFHRAAVAGGT